jgi:tripartite-type tricarboxylate transporter receptor subunit TctC
MSWPGRYDRNHSSGTEGIDLTVVPYKSTGPLLTDLAGHHIPLGITGASTAVPFIKDKTIRVIAMTSAEALACPAGCSDL